MWPAAPSPKQGLLAKEWRQGNVACRSISKVRAAGKGMEARECGLPLHLQSKGCWQGNGGKGMWPAAPSPKQRLLAKEWRQGNVACRSISKVRAAGKGMEARECGSALPVSSGLIIASNQKAPRAVTDLRAQPLRTYRPTTLRALFPCQTAGALFPCLHSLARPQALYSLATIPLPDRKRFIALASIPLPDRRRPIPLPPFPCQAASALFPCLHSLARPQALYSLATIPLPGRKRFIPLPPFLCQARG